MQEVGDLRLRAGIVVRTELDELDIESGVRGRPEAPCMGSAPGHLLTQAGPESVIGTHQVAGDGAADLYQAALLQDQPARLEAPPFARAPRPARRPPVGRGRRSLPIT
jgi:hypothetical protein